MWFSKEPVYADSVNEFLKEHGDDLHSCEVYEDGVDWHCYEWEGFELLLSAKQGEIEVNFCPFCGFKSRKK